MTLVGGAVCDDGVIVWTDSVRACSRPSVRWPWEEPKPKLDLDLSARKIGLIKDRFAFVTSGAFSSPRWPSRPRDFATVEDFATRFFARLETRAAPLAGHPFWEFAGSPEEDDIQLLAGGSFVGAQPELVFIRRPFKSATGTPAGPAVITRVPPHGVVMAGVMEGWHRHVGLDRAAFPPSVDEMLPIAVAIAHACTAFWTQLLQGMKLVSFPLQVAIITPDTSRVLNVPEFDVDAGDRVMAALRGMGLNVQTRGAALAGAPLA